VHVPAGVRPAEERDEGLEQATRQPLVRTRAGDVRGLVLEAARVLLRRHRPAVEERRVHRADLLLGRDLHVDGNALLQISRVAVERNHGVRVGRAGFRAVVRPLEALDRVAQRREALARRRVRLRLPKRLQTLQPDRVALRVVEPLEAEASEAGTLARREVEAEEDDVCPGDGVDGQSCVLRPTAL
jgi:hypothetical protein